jgi:hypothetical protein
LSQAVLKDAVWALEDVLHICPEQRPHVCLRLDAGFGTDDNLRWLLRRRYEVIAKNNSGRRAGAWGKQVPEWQEIVAGQRWVGMPPQQLQFSVPTRTIAVRWLDRRKVKLKHALYVVTDLERPLVEMCHRYDLRGGAEIDIRDDKQGLLLTHRRRRFWHAQETLVLLNDLAHNFLSLFRHRVLAGTPLAALGPFRLIRDVLAMPGEAIIRDEQLAELRLAQSHPYAAILADVLLRLWQ